jgi:hypothetical protein
MNGTIVAMEFNVKAACIAEKLALVGLPPEGGGGSRAI